MGKTQRQNLSEYRGENNSLPLRQMRRCTTTSKRREAWASDPYRPIYHMSSLYGMGDANGLCEWQGRYHLFYQFGPPDVDRVHWGHCYSEDLVHWYDLPPALYPDTELHCFSGQCLVEDDRVVAIYHGKMSGNSIATASDPLLLNWKKHPNNPVIPNVETNEYEQPYNVFDPCIWKEEDGYYSISGTSTNGGSVNDAGQPHISFIQRT